MPRISDRFINSVAYLYPSEAEAEDGVKLGGSGFFVDIRLGLANLELLCVVTNKHVVDGGSTTVRVNTPDDKFDVIPLDGATWYYHPDGDDIAVCPMGFNTTLHRISSISSDAFLTKKMASATTRSLSAALLPRRKGAQYSVCSIWCHRPNAGGANCIG